MEQTTQNPKTNLTPHVHKHRAWVVALSSVLVTLIIAGSAFGSYLAYVTTIRDREVRELNNTVESLKKELSDMKKVSAPVVTPTFALKTYTDNDVNITFQYQDNMNVVAGTVGQAVVSNNNVGKTKTITVTDVDGNKLTLEYSDARISCDSVETTIGRLRENADWVEEYSADAKLYRFNDYYYLAENETDSSEQVCIEGLVQANTVAKLNVSLRSKLSAFDNIIKTLKKV